WQEASNGPELALAQEFLLNAAQRRHHRVFLRGAPGFHLARRLVTENCVEHGCLVSGRKMPQKLAEPQLALGPARMLMSGMPASDINRTIDAVWRMESAKVIAGLARVVRDVGLAEELAQDALV